MKLVMRPDGSNESVSMDAAEDAARAAEEQEWADSAATRSALKEIARLEAEMTPRRMREHLAGDEVPVNWWADQTALINAERSKL
ncbi:hypothetical protein OAF54_00765 [bacterium]|nr:hypothetical protein [bacterium]